MNRTVAPNIEKTADAPILESLESDSRSLEQDDSATLLQNTLPPNWLTIDSVALARRGPIQSVEWPAAINQGVSLCVKRDDLVDPELGGNKLYKLYGHLNRYLSTCTDSSNLKALATFGGAYSNHLYALAEAAQRLSLPCIGVIRGEEPAQYSSTLIDLKSKGMNLVFVSRQDYQRRHTERLRQSIEKESGECFWIPEGGSGELGQIGARALGFEISNRLERDLDSASITVCLSCGTATTMSGVVEGIYCQLSQRTSNRSQNIKVLGFSALKSRSSLVRTLYTLTNPEALAGISWQISNQFHCGGYAKLTQALLDFMVRFEQKTHIPSDKVYTAKLFWALDKLLEQGFWSSGSRIVAIHSGGLQGNR